jgi:predicted nucleic acid-binding protein
MASDDRPVAFVDSSAIVALVDEDDAAHSAAVDAYRELSTSGYRLFTTDHVVVEAYDLLLNGVGPVVATAWLRDQRLPV